MHGVEHYDVEPCYLGIIDIRLAAILCSILVYSLIIF